MATLAEYRQSIIDTSPFVYWSGEEGTGTTLGDDSGNARDGTATLAAGGWEMPKPFPQGRTAYALITSTGATQAANWTGTLPIGGAGTAWAFMVWVKVISTAAGQTCFAIETSGSSTSFRLNVVNLVCQYYLNATSNFMHSLVTGTWANIIGTCSSTTLTVYKDGVSAGTMAAQNLAGHDRLMVRSVTGGSAEFAHLAFWNRALTAGEISTFQTAVTGTLPSSAVFAPQIPPIYSLPRTRTALSIPPIYYAPRASSATTKVGITSNVTVRDTVDSSALTTASVTPIPLSSAADTVVDVDIIAATLIKTQTNITATQQKERIVATTPWVYYPMDDGAGTTVTDASGNGRNATLNATMATWQAETATSTWGDYSVVKNTTIGDGVTFTGSIPLMTSTQGYSFMACVNITSYFTNFHRIVVGQLVMADSITPTLVATINGNGLGARSAAASTWYKMLFTHDESGNWRNYSISAANSIAITAGASIGQPTADPSSLIINANGSSGTMSVQHVAFWDRVLTHQEIVDIVMGDVVTTGLIDLVGSMTVEADSISGSLSADLVGYIPLDLGTATMDVEVSTADAPLYTLISGAMDMDVTLASDPIFLTTFVAISSTTDMLVDVQTNTPVLRKSTPLTSATALSVLTLNSGAVTGLTSYIAAPANAVYTLRSFVRTSYRPPMSIPRQVTEPVSDTDPAQATGIVIRAMMGVAVDMDNPIIVDGKPS
jgi:hypothetical protein